MFRFPKYPPKGHASGNARIRIKGKDYYLGKYGSEESRKEYARLAAEFASNPALNPPPKVGAEQVTIAMLVSLWTQAHSGAESNQVTKAAKPLVRLFGDSLACEFSAARLEVVRNAMVDCSWMNADEHAERANRKKEPGWSRNHVNHQISRIKRIFKWGELREHVPRGTGWHLSALPPLERGKGRKNKSVKPVDDATIEATLPHLPLMVAAMVTVQLAAGLRPSELVGMRADAIDTSGDVWIYRLGEYKTDGLDDAPEYQSVVLGPRCQAALRPWLEHAMPDKPIWMRGLSVLCQMTTGAYYQAIEAACDQAGVDRWNPYRVRHSQKRKVERVYGEQGARSFLRQRSIQSTREYADEQDLEMAKKIAKDLG